MPGQNGKSETENMNPQSNGASLHEPLEKIRDILFGAQVKEQTENLQALNNQLQAEINRLAEKLDQEKRERKEEASFLREELNQAKTALEQSLAAAVNKFSNDLATKSLELNDSQVKGFQDLDFRKVNRTSLAGLFAMISRQLEEIG